MAATFAHHLTRRSIIAGGFCAVATTMIEPAAAQSVTVPDMTDKLRDGLQPRAEPSPYPLPGPSAPQPEPRPTVQPSQSAIPSPGSVGARQDEIEVYVTIDPMRSVDMPVQFALDSADLDWRARQLLAALGRLLQTDLRPYRYLIAGHTDVTGVFDYNMKLSMWRAIAVRRHLIEIYGVDPRRLFVAGFGPTALRDRSRPRSPINRRVEVVLVTGTR